MMKFRQFIAGIAAAALLTGQAYALPASDTPVITGPQNVPVFAGSLLVTPTGGAQTTLAQALAAGGGGGGVSSVVGVTGVVTLGQLVTGGVASTANVTSAISAATSGLAPLASPGLTGTPTTPTGTVGDTSTQIANNAFVAAAVAAGGGGGCTTGCTFGGLTNVGTLTSAGVITSNGGFTTTAVVNAGTFYKIGGQQVLTTLSKQNSSGTPAIVSPETANAPNSFAVYIDQSIVQGFAETAAGNTYSSMYTNNLTVNGTHANHWGLEEHSINLIGTGTPNQTGELNVQKNYILVPAGFTVSGGGEHFEGMIDNFGTIGGGGFAGYIANPVNEATGTASSFTGFVWQPTNFNTAANSFGAGIGYACNPQAGGGSAISAGHNQCFFNSDAKADFSNAGHWSSRPDGGNGGAAPTTTCGTGSLSSRASDAGGQITVGTGLTSCTLTFANPYDFAMSFLMVVASDGLSQPTYTYSTSGITLSAVRAGGVYQYWANGGY